MGGCNPDWLTTVWTLCSCLDLLLDLHISYIRASHAWTSTTTFSYPYCFPVPISSLRPPELYTQLISVSLSCKQCNLSYQTDLHLAIECQTYTWLVSPAEGLKKKNGGLNNSSPRALWSLILTCLKCNYVMYYHIAAI